jgi:hypothetical protein
MIKLTNIYESVVSEDYPQSFDMKFFKTLQSFASRKKYCDEHLKKIAQGSSRIVYFIDSEKVLKLAKNKKGLAQNEVEIDYSDDYMLTNIVAPVYDYHENFLWLEMALAKKVKKSDFKRITGIDFDGFGDVLVSADSLYRDKNLRFKVDQDLVEEVMNNEFTSGVYDYVANFDVPASDMRRINSYGLIKVNGKEQLAIIDYGLTTDVFKNYYS